ncbi:hypothetical protein JDN40_14265 [Rhodomicrobium vannielii ATCC 17100]|uniref:hypothetical protein n=1 Tax=Rhodomicrobium vannielii TaxID=1069 RepID=UPI00191B68D5|nr:hypothetical protein [Rhodomicrobium vannielii]MBJ7535272.1 hypothetical protein [Rhodomicrobium vannielii ATCC 17100]
MSWSFEFVAANKEDASALVDEQYAPANVKTFIKEALAGLKGDGAQSSDAPKVVFVRSAGHLADGKSYEVSSNSTEVKYLYLRQPKSEDLVTAA